MEPTLTPSPSVPGFLGSETGRRLQQLRAWLAKGHADSKASLPVAFFAAALVLQFKAPDSLSNPQFWAEDGVIFFQQQQHSKWPLLLVPYASYFHAIPRLVAWFASFWPAKMAPTLYCYGAWLIGSLGLASLRQLSLAYVPFLVILAGVALSPTNGEAFGTLTNVQWLLQFYLLSIMARLSEGRPSRMPWLRCVAAVLVGLTGPFSIFAAISIAVLMIAHRLAPRLQAVDLGTSSNPELVGLMLSALVQAFSIAVSLNPESTATPRPFNASEILSGVGSIQLHTFRVEFVARPLAAIGVCLVVAVGLLLARGRDRYVLCAAYLFAGFQLFAAVSKLRHSTFEELALWGYADRYYLLIKALLVWQGAVFVARFARSSSARGLGFGALLSALAVGHYSNLQRSRFPDMNWDSFAERARAGERVEAIIFPPPWRVHLLPGH